MTDKEQFYLTLADILATDDIPTEDVEIPEWGGTVKVRGMSGNERAQLNEAMRGPDGEIDLTAAGRLGLKIGLADPKVTNEQLDALMEKSSAAIERISRVFLRLSGVREEDLLAERGES